MRPRQFGNKKPSKAVQRATVQMLLVQRPSLDDLNLDSLVRSYGLPAAEIEALIKAEKARRVLR